MATERTYPSRPLVGAGALVHRGNRVLLVKRRRPPNKGAWVFPGGLVELGESVEEAVIREVKEETGMTVKLERLLGVYTEVRKDAGGRVKYDYVIVDYSAVPADSTVKLNEESTEYGWFTPGKMKALPISENIQACVRKFEQSYGRGTLGIRPKASARAASSAVD